VASVLRGRSRSGVQSQSAAVSSRLPIVGYTDIRVWTRSRSGVELGVSYEKASNLLGSVIRMTGTVAHAAARILIADDSDDLRRALRNVLEARRNFTVCGKASSGAEAVTKARELSPDLVILDFQMPDMNGFDTARQIFAFAPVMPILIFSMYFSTQHLQEAHKIGIRGFIQKGTSFETLIEGVESVLQGESFFLAKSEE
jgi:CheY-like chemotaxis protein